MAHYYDENPSGPLREEKIIVRLFNKELPFFSASGLFSKSHLDHATRLLIEKSDLSQAKDVLDLGCGWGVVGVVLKIQNKQFNMTCSDVNSRALTYTMKNAKKHKVDINVVRSNVFEKIDQEFDTILTNPPYVAGRAICFQFIEDSYKHLKKDGSLQLVARHTKGGKVLSEKMEAVFGNVESLAKQSGFRIYKSVKN